MATWLSSKLKVAEHLLNQIDQHAADSLGRQEEKHSDLSQELVPVSSSDNFLQEKNVASTSTRSPSPAPDFQISWGAPATSREKDDWTEILAGSDPRTSRDPERKLNVKRYRAQPQSIHKKKVGSTGAARLTRPELEGGGRENADGETCLQPSETSGSSKPNDYQRVQSKEEVLECKAAIEERQSFVRKLEMEKEALEGLLAEREEQQRKEAGELRTSMIELIQAADLEKQRHSRTIMEALARESALQNESVELAKTLAAAQRKLDMEFTGLVDARTRVEIKRIAVAELERKVSKRRSIMSSSLDSHQEQLNSALSEEKEKVLYEIDYYKTQLRNLEGEIASTRFSQQMQSDRERELGYRLVQLTDHLIQKQAEVEALSTEKATLFFRLETLSSPEKLKARSIDNIDVEAGSFSGNSELLKHKVDTLFVEVARVLGMHKPIRTLAAAYFLLLHVWVVFVCLRHARL